MNVLILHWSVLINVSATIFDEIELNLNHLILQSTFSTKGLLTILFLWNCLLLFYQLSVLYYSCLTDGLVKNFVKKKLFNLNFRNSKNIIRRNLETWSFSSLYLLFFTKHNLIFKRLRLILNYLYYSFVFIIFQYAGIDFWVINN